MVILQIEELYDENRVNVCLQYIDEVKLEFQVPTVWYQRCGQESDKAKPLIMHIPGRTLAAIIIELAGH